MTIIEQQTMNAIQSMNKKMADQHPINWERRRYEIAKEVLTYCAQTSKELLMSGGKLDGEGNFFDRVSEQAVHFADALINQLKKKRHDKEEQEED